MKNRILRQACILVSNHLRAMNMFLINFYAHRTSLEKLRRNIYCTLIKLPFINYNYAINNNGRNATSTPPHEATGGEFNIMKTKNYSL